VIAGLTYWRSKRNSTRSLLERLPADGVVLSLDFDGLRRVGLLDLFSASASIQDPEYRTFVEQTGFDYLRDLDAALVSFHPTGTYLLLRGRFDWWRLGAHVARQRGSCLNAFCRMQGSAPERNISYFPLSPNLMALAMSKDDSAAGALMTKRSWLDMEIPAGPAWSVIPASVLRDTERLPAGTRAFTRPLEDASRIVFTLGPSGDSLRLQLDVTCNSAESAAALAGQLRTATARLRDFIAREKQTPNSRDLSGVLTAGVFEQKGTNVIGRWPITPEFLESIARGAL